MTPESGLRSLFPLCTSIVGTTLLLTSSASLKPMIGPSALGSVLSLLSFRQCLPQSWGGVRNLKFIKSVSTPIKLGRVILIVVSYVESGGASSLYWSAIFLVCLILNLFDYPLFCLFGSLLF